MRWLGLCAGAVVLAASGVWGQALPRIAALYPAGARTGSTVEVTIRGGGLEGAKELLVAGKGLSASLNASDVKVNPDEQKVFVAKCGLCHELRGPATISRTAEQWTATVDRMISQRGAPIEPAERARIVSYMQAASRAGALTARVTVAPDATPGIRELRVVTSFGTSTAFPFEVTTQPETLETEPNNEVAKAPELKIPVTVSGQIAAGDLDSYRISARKGERLVFNCNAYRLNPGSQAFFFPVLYLYDAQGKQLAKNTGYFGLDPLIDWTAPADGEYVIQVRDMLYRGSPSSIYRLSVGALPYDTYLFPAGGRRGETVSATLSGENLKARQLPIGLESNAPLGMRQVATAEGSFPFVVGEAPEAMEGGDPLPLPISLNGRITARDEVDRFNLQVAPGQTGVYSFESFVERIGSAVGIRMRVLDPRGRALGNDASVQGRPDPRLDVNLSQPGTYVLEVGEGGGKAGPRGIYRIQVTPSQPDMAVVVSPDNPNLGPGTNTYLQVRVLRRTGITGEMEVTFPNLPPGVTATAARIRPDQNQAFVVLSAAANAQPGSFAMVKPIVRSVVQGKTVTQPALVQEYYRINNNAMTSPRESMVVSVGPSLGWTMTLEATPREMAPGRPITVTARLQRNGVTNDIPFAIAGVPDGVQGPRSLLFKRGVSEMTFTLTGNSNSPVFNANGAGYRPRDFQITVVSGREGENMMMCSPPLSIPVQGPPQP